MAYLGILEGNARLSDQFARPVPYGTLASSRYRRSIGPALLGSDIPEIVLADAKAAANAAVAAAKATGTSGPGIAAAGKNAYDKVIANWRASLPTGTVTPPPFETTSSAGTKTQDELRNYYNVPAPTPEPTPQPPSNVPDKVTQEDLRKVVTAEAKPFVDLTSAEKEARNQAALYFQPKKFILPIAAIAAAYFFLKG